MDSQIIAAVVGGVATISTAIIGWWLQNKTGKNKNELGEKEVVSVSSAAFENNKTEEAAKDSTSIVAPSPQDYSSITVEEIIKAINAAPPFQRDSISVRYNGIRINWVGYLSRVMQDPIDKESVQINLNVKRNDIIGYSFWLSEKLTNFPEVKALHRESEIRVLGEITGASGEGLCVRVAPIAIEITEGLY